MLTEERLLSTGTFSSSQTRVRNQSTAVIITEETVRTLPQDVCVPRRRRLQER